MRSVLRLKDLGFGRILRRPDLRPTEEEPLFRSESVDVRRTRFSFERFHERIVSHRKSREVADVLAECKFSDHEDPGLHFISVPLFHDTCGTLLEQLSVVSRPPHLQIALSVKSTAL